ncbi:MAG: hypothetical protein JNG88_11650 [Phycisphaerales bacterium]|nr:hypothetical protein [Phycisphaerales bacterium]
MSMINKRDDNPANRDPITGAPGAHPVGVGVGAAAGGVAGAAAGSIGGPVGAAVGAGVGAVVGGLAGKGAAEQIDPTVEDAYWRENYAHRPYVPSGAPYTAYRPAFQFGWESKDRYPGKKYDEIESDLEREWTRSEHSSTLPWDKARPAVKDAWGRCGACGCG